MKKILLITFSQDNSCIETVSGAISRKGGLPVRFDTDLYPGNTSLSLDDNNGKWSNMLSTEQGSFNLSEFESLWYRRIRIGTQLREIMEDKFVKPSIDESRRTFFGMLGALDIFQLDSHHNVNRANSKQLQLKLAHEIGLKTPKTLITNDPAAVKAFRKTCSSGMISKMQESFAIYENGVENVVFTNVIEEDDMNDMDDLKYCPMTFQELLHKKLELRITVVGEQVFAASIDSQRKETARTDWRKEGLAFLNDWEKFDLSADIREKILTLMDRLGLNYGAIDMILTPADELYFLEVNPVGEFFWLEKNPGFPISDAIADVLMGNTKRRTAPVL